MKITAIHSGGDWYDASADYLILPEGMDITQEETAHRRWYDIEYIPNLSTPHRIGYISFVDWLKLKGAVEPTDDQLEIVTLL